MKYVVLLGNPVAHIESSSFRDLSKFNTVFGHKLLIDCLLEIMKLVEAKIAYEMENTIGALIYDAWTQNVTHYIGAYPL